MKSESGYAGKILRVDLSSRKVTSFPTSDYADRFIGGRGIAVKIYWDEVSPDVKALQPENRLIFATGPLAGFPGLAGSRWQVCGKSPVAEHFSYGNAGGSWGAWLKFAGYDGIVIHGKSDKPVYLFIQDGIAEIKDASALWGKGCIETREILKGELGSDVRIVAIGPAGENMVTYATLIADEDSSISSGFGAVAGSKNLKALAVRGNRKAKAANPERLQELIKDVHKLASDTPKFPSWFFPPWSGNKQLCYSCSTGCVRMLYKSQGKMVKHMCQSSTVYLEQAARYYQDKTKQPKNLFMGIEHTEAAFLANKLCDQYGLNTMVVLSMLIWIEKCYQAGILNDKNTGMPLSKFGSLEFIETMLRKTALRDGFGDVLAQGIFAAADIVGNGAKDLISDYICNKTGEFTQYDGRMYIITGLLYAMEPRQPIQQLHDVMFPVGHWIGWIHHMDDTFVSSEVIRAIAKRFWGSEIAVDFSTYEGKALAAKIIQDRTYAKESLILCDFMWPMQYNKYSENGAGDPTIESKILSAVTGKELGEEELLQLGERIFNLQRATLVRERRQGRESDKLPEVFYTKPLGRLPYPFPNDECLVPGAGGFIISRKGTVVDRESFEKMKDEYYQLRGWDVACGFQTKAKLKELGLQDIIEELAQRGLIA